MPKQRAKNTLNDVDRYFIKGNPDMSNEELAKILNVIPSSVKKYRDNEALKEPDEEAKNQKTGRIIKKKGTSIVLTPSGSQISDDSVRKTQYNPSCTYPIYPKGKPSQYDDLREEDGIRPIDE